MMVIHVRNNLYPGINIHLNSYLQNESGGWESFHSKHITHLDDSLSLILPTGYFTRAGGSLQITGLNPETQHVMRTSIKPDVSIYQSGSEQQAGSVPITRLAPTTTLALVETFEEEDRLSSIVIYQAGEESPLGRPITRIELLSPSNKQGGSHYEQYRLKRMQTLLAGLRMVEIDYLHETPPIIRKVVRYPAEGAHPYRILISDPRPQVDKGKTDVFGWGVADPLPTIAIPLAGVDIVELDFAAAYERTYSTSSYFWQVVDYAVDPVALDKYHPADQARIHEMLAAIREN